MTSVTRDGTRLEQLKALALVIAAQIDDGDDTHSMAQLARQYRETIREIEELEDGTDDGDPIAGIIANGKARSDKAGRA